MHKIKLFIKVFLVSLLFATSASANACTSEEMTVGNTVASEWTVACNSTHRTGSYAKYYTFTLDNPKAVIINLNSTIDTYLFLLSGTDQSSTPIAENDDYNGFNSQISIDLAAGTYTIEATTFSSNELGSFELSLGEVIVRKFRGEVTLPTEITDLLDNCNAEECPSISVNINGEEWAGGSVDYNDSSQAYEYHFETITGASDVNYAMEMYIFNGDRGNESFVYSFGTDNQVGGTGDAADVMYHWDELWSSETPIVVEPLLVSADTDTVVVDLDFTNKNVGRHKVTGEIHLPLDINMSDTVDEGPFSYYKNILTVFIEGSNTWFGIDVNRIAEGGNNDYAFVTSMPHNLPESSKLSIFVSGVLYDHNIQATYKVAPADKFVSGWLDSSENYIEFSQTVADFGTMDMAAYLDGYELLTGSVKVPSNFLDRGAERYMSLSVYGNTFNGYSSYIDLYDYNASTPPVFSIFIPGSEKDTIKQEGLKFSLNFNWWSDNYNNNGYFNSYYTFGEDKSVGGTGVNEDHLLEGCIDPNDATELVVSTSSSYPVVNMDLSNYVVPYTFKAIGTLPVPSDITYLNFWGSDTSCNNNGGAYGWAWNNGDGTWSYEITNLLEGSTYAILVDYFDSSNWYQYVLNDNDMDLTTEGVFLDEIRYEETVIYPDPLATITGSADEEIAIAPFEFILPASGKAVSPALIMYLLN